jgi:hypothetical protein
MKLHHILAAFAATLALGVSAQTFTGVTATPATVKVGENVTATMNFDVQEGKLNCSMRVSWGDGTNTDDKINQAQDVPKVLQHAYAKPGTYTITAEPKHKGSTLKCLGKNMTASVTVAAPVAAAPAPAAAATPVAAAPMAKAAAAPTCPAGWTLAKPGVSKKTKSFTCTAKANTPLPEPKVTCPGDLTYFENTKKGQLGCRV